MDSVSSDVAAHTITGLSLCSGIGGIELGLRQVYGSRYRTICYVEGEIHCAAALASRMQEGALCDAPIWSNLKTFDAKPWRGIVDIISAGYPCQPFSTAGKRKGENDPRHLWPYVARAVDTIKPTAILCENVPGHISMGFEQVCQDLQGMGYSIEAGLFSAQECGAPHVRQRLFFLAYSSSSRCKAWGSNSLRIGEEGGGGSVARARGADDAPHAAPRGGAQPWETEPQLGRMDNGIPHRLERLRALGNAVVPAVAAKAFTTLLERIE